MRSDRILCAVTDHEQFELKANFFFNVAYSEFENFFEFPKTCLDDGASCCGFKNRHPEILHRG